MDEIDQVKRDAEAYGRPLIESLELLSKVAIDLRERLARAQTVLRSYEWSDRKPLRIKETVFDDFEVGCCPVCRADRIDGHRGACAIAEALGRHHIGLAPRANLCRVPIVQLWR